MAGILKSASIIAGGTAFGQILAFLASLLLVRIYSPEEFGLFTTLSAIASCLVPFASGRYELAIPLPEKDDDAWRLGRVSILLASGSSTVLFVLILVTRQYVSGPAAAIVEYAWALPTLVLALGMYQTANQLAVRAELYKQISIRGFIFPLSMSVVQISVGWLGWGSEGLILGLVLGHLLGFWTLWQPSRKHHHDTVGVRPYSFASYRPVVSDYRRFPMLLSLSGSLNALAVQVPLIAVSMTFGLEDAGQFGVMLKVLALPVALIGQSLSYVYTGHIAKLGRERKMSSTYVFMKTTKQLLAVSVVGVLIVVFAAPAVFPTILGEAWAPSGDLARLYVVAIGAQMVVAPLSQTLLIAGKPGTQFIFDTVRVIAVVITFGFCAWSGSSLNQTVLASAITVTITYGLLWYANWRAAISLVTTAKSTDPLTGAP